MIRIAISVEGPTEDEFCKQVLVPYFRNFNIELVSIIITTKRKNCGIKYKGGCVNLGRIKSELTKILPNFDYVTTFYDLYGFDIKGTYTAEELENEIGELFDGNRKLIPYIQKYEFETLLFSKPSFYEDYFLDSAAKVEIEKIIASCGGVENINNSRETAPSKRIDKFFDKYNEQYDKVFHGPSIADDIGLDIILDKCARFKDWIETIQKLTKL
ncbi:MAG: hypothetical protein ACI81I_000937 [Arcobacteraceae bacterium]|jgi:hypothetical protein